MKHSSESVSLRIKRFMDSKMTEYPELKQKYGPRVAEVQRGYLWEDLLSLYKRRAGVR